MIFSALACAVSVSVLILNFSEFSLFLNSFSKGIEKGLWEKRIVNTALPCIAVPCDVVKKVTNEISKGNFISFIDFWPWQNHTQTVIVGNLICKICDFNLFKKYLTIYANKIDNWASCDSLKFKITNKNNTEYFNIALELINENKTFVRRVGLIILFKLIKYKEFLNKIFKVLNSFYSEQEYYVNMMLSWLFCECFIKHKTETKQFLKNHTMSRFVINKGISKCKDSFRVSKEDKDWLNKYKQK